MTSAGGPAVSTHFASSPCSLTDETMAIAFWVLSGYLPLRDHNCPDLLVPYSHACNRRRATDIALDLYYLAFPEDRRLTKSVVYFVFIVGTVQIALSLRDFYMLFCTITGNNWLVDLDVHNFGFMWLTIPLSASAG